MKDAFLLDENFNGRQSFLMLEFDYIFLDGFEHNPVSAFSVLTSQGYKLILIQGT